MRINDGEKLSAWIIGNTGVRNPMRIPAGFRVFASSPYVGDCHGKPKEIAFTRLLHAKGIVDSEGKDGTIGRKWRLMFARYGFVYDETTKQNGFTQEELGNPDDITPFGRIFLKADTLPAIQECFLRALSVEQYWLNDMSGHYSPFRWVLALMLELERRTGSSEISRLEFVLWVQTTDPRYDINDVVDHILDLRNRRNLAPAKSSFDSEEIARREKYYVQHMDTIKTYADMNIRYLRMSGILHRKGRGIIIDPSKHAIAVALAKTMDSKTPMLAEFKQLTKGASLPTDDIIVARKVLSELQKQLKERHIVYNISDLPLNTAAEVNIARGRLEEQLSQMNEIVYAEKQPEQWREIADYMELLMKGGGKKSYDEDYEIEVPKEDAAVYLEWTLWRAALAINHLTNKPYEVRGFRIDSDFLPVSVAGGGRGDLYCDYGDYMVLIEVTMSTSSRQEAMEGEPVRRHVSDAMSKYDKPVYGLFVASRVDTNTIETFKHGIWYAGKEKQRLTILPLSLEQYRDYFVSMFKEREAEPQRIANLIKRCIAYRDCVETMKWRNHIDKMVKLGPICTYDIEEEKEDFIEETAQDVFYNLSEDDRDFLRVNSDPIMHHFGLGMYIRNSYIYGKDLGDLSSQADNLSNEITKRVISLCQQK